MKKKKCLLVSLVVLCCIFFVFLFALYFAKINKYKMSDIEVEQYEQAMKNYQDIIAKIDEQSGIFYKQYNAGNDISEEYLNNIYILYNQLIGIKFPEKYVDLYNELIYAKIVYGLSNDFAYIAFDPILDENVGNYFPPNEIGEYIKQLEDQLYNKSYAPKNNINIDFEQIYYKIIQEYYKDNKSVSEVYDELSEIFYHKDFLQRFN